MLKRHSIISAKAHIKHQVKQNTDNTTSVFKEVESQDINFNTEYSKHHHEQSANDNNSLFLSKKEKTEAPNNVATRIPRTYMEKHSLQKFILTCIRYLNSLPKNHHEHLLDEFSFALAKYGITGHFFN